MKYRPGGKHRHRGKYITVGEDKCESGNNERPRKLFANESQIQYKKNQEPWKFE